MIPPPPPPATEIVHIVETNLQQVMKETLMICSVVNFTETICTPVEGTVDGAPVLSEQLGPQVTVEALSTFQATHMLHAKGLKPLVLDMANSSRPGGGSLEGARAQEETLCRQSNLYPALQTAPYPLSDTGGILVQNVTFFRDDSYALVVPFEVDVFASAAFDCNSDHKPDPARNLVGYNRPALDSDYEAGTKAKMRAYFRAAKMNGNDALVLSAFGCGAFRNDPVLISRWYKDVLREKEFEGAFKEIVFGILGGNDSKNFRTFNEFFTDQKV
jgi:uncharacterized protein (TIGR02452 family)